MRRPCALLLVLLGLTAAAGLAAGAPPRADSPAARAVIRECVQRAKPDLVGMDALRADCPTLAKAIEDLGLAAHLPQDWKEQVTPDDLADWSALTDRYDGSAVPLPDGARLQTIARFLQPLPEPPNWWERFKTWVGSWFDPERGQWPGWLRWPAQWRPGNAILYGVMGLVLIAAAVVIAMELRAAGVFGAGRRRAPPKRAATDTPTRSPHWQEPEEIDESVEQLGPDRLLRVLVAALTKSHRLEHDRDLTCRELITAARFDTTAQREIFASVALLAEPILYGDPRHAPKLNDRKLGQSAGRLYGELLAAPAGQPPK